MIDGVTARSVVLSRNGYTNLSFPSDLCWPEDKIEILELIKTVDLIHLHNYVDLKTDCFYPIDFKSLWDSYTPIVRQFHSTPDLICRYKGITKEELSSCPIPRLVISQYPERFYPSAKVVPNIVTNFSSFPCDISKPVRIGYSPSNFRRARECRWDTKGYIETRSILNKFVKKAKKKGLSVDLDIMEGVPFDECLRRKSSCDIVIDDLVTGSYHMSSLEGLASGALVLAFVDERVREQTMMLADGTFLPLVNTKLENLLETLIFFCENRLLMNEFRYSSLAWMKKNWDPVGNAELFIDVYRQVIDDPRLVFPSRYDESSRVDQWLAIGKYDFDWALRHQYWPRERPAVVRYARGLARKLLDSLHIEWN